MSPIFRVLLLFLVLDIIFVLLLYISRRQQLLDLTSRKVPQKPSKPFVYLLQTEGCIPEYFLNDFTVGNPKACLCDVIVLSYKRPCPATAKSNVSHVNYITKNDCTWASGRNELFYAALQRKGKSYWYYIFMDDDIKLTFAESAPMAMTVLSPFRVFEQWLLDFEPVIGVPHYVANEGKGPILNYRKSQGCAMDDANRTVLSTVHFDPLFNAFHSKAIHHLLPYSEAQDFECWWTSNRLVSASAEIKFRGQSVLYLMTEVDNPAHRPYPRSCSYSNQEIPTREHIIALRDEVPFEFRNHSIIGRFIDKPLGYVHDAETLCFNPKPKMDIAPYRHFW